jgi:hypothetical protein
MIAPHPALFAVAVVLAGAADWELVVNPPAPEPICAKSEATCEAAVRAVREFGLFADLGIVEMRCLPHPGCFPQESNFIRGFNAPGDRR